MSYTKLEKLLLEFKKDKKLEIHQGYLGDSAKGDKKQLHIYSRNEVSIGGRKPQKTYIAGVIQQKNFVGFYFMPQYSHPQVFKDKSQSLTKSLKGKSCFHITLLDKETLEELREMLKKGVTLYKKEGWV